MYKSTNNFLQYKTIAVKVSAHCTPAANSVSSLDPAVYSASSLHPCCLKCQLTHTRWIQKFNGNLLDDVDLAQLLLNNLLANTEIDLISCKVNVSFVSSLSD